MSLFSARLLFANVGILCGISTEQSFVFDEISSHQNLGAATHEKEGARYFIPIWPTPHATILAAFHRCKHSYAPAIATRHRWMVRD